MANSLHIPPFNPARSTHNSPPAHHHAHSHHSSARHRPATATVTPYPTTPTPIRTPSHSLHPDPLALPPSSQPSSTRHRQPPTHLFPASPTDPHSNHVSMVGPSHPMPRQRVYFGPYLLLQTLGEGEFGKVKLGVHSSPDRWGEEVAIKLIKRGNVDTQARMIKVAREIDVLKLVRHPNIVRLYDVIETEKYIGIVLEYASGGELFDHILAHRYLKEKDAAKLFAQLISGVTYLHSKKIVHRDLKLENLLLDRNRNIIITDFGFANRFEDRSSDLMATSCGSPCYAAPELVVQDGRYVGSQVDVWSCGVILYAMLAGYLPFDDDPSNPDGDNINLLYKYIINTPLSFPEWISDQPKDLLLRMLVPDPLKRCSLKDVIHHSWLAKYQHLFHRSLEELERLSDENEHNKRLMLQRQRQMMAAGNANGARSPAGTDFGHGLGSLNGSNPVPPSHKARAHQSAMVIPTSSLTRQDDHRQPYTPPGAYHQQQRQQAAGVVTHLQSSPHPPSALSVPVNRRNPQTQSATVVPVSNHNDHILLHPAPRPTHMDNSGELFGSHLPLASSANDNVIVMDDDAKTSLSSRASAIAPMPEGGTSDIPLTSAESLPPPPLPQHSQRHTVQVEYSGLPANPNNSGGSKGKAKVDESSCLSCTSPQDQGSTLPTDNAPGPTDSGGELATPTMPVQSDVSAPLTPRALGPPAPLRTRPLPEVTSPPFTTSVAALNRQPSPKSTASNSSGLDPNKLSFPSPLEPPLISTSNGHDKLAIGTSNANQSQVSFSAASQASAQAGSVPGLDALKAEARHKKGLSTDRFLARFLGGVSASSSSVSALVNTLPSPPHNAKKQPGYTTVPATTQSVRRKALSLVVEPLSGKISSATGVRASRKSSKVPSIPRPSTTSKLASADQGARRVRGATIKAEPLQSSPGLESSQSHSIQVPPLPVQRRTTVTAAHRPTDVAQTSNASRVSPSFTSPFTEPGPSSPLADHGVERSLPGSALHEEDISRKRETRTASPNWSHHTVATVGGNSLGQSSSNNSKAKRVMDWFRFKSLNHSTVSTPNSYPSHSAGHHGSPPVPIPTDFDARQKVKGSNKPATGFLSYSTSPAMGKPLDPVPGAPPGDGNSVAVVVSAAASPSLPQTAPMAKPNQQFPFTNSTTNGVPSDLPAAPTAFNDAKLKLHHGAIDQNAISSKSPPSIMYQLKQILWDLGIDVTEENPMKLKATRRSKKKVVASLGMGVFEALRQQQQQQQAQPQGVASQAQAAAQSSGGTFRLMFQNKSSAHSNAQIGVVIDQFGQVSTGGFGINRGSGSAEGAGQQAGLLQPLPAYASDPSVDSGDDVRFTVEITKLRGLVGLYAVDIKRLKGSLWSFKYLYLQILERADLGRK